MKKKYTIITTLLAGIVLPLAAADGGVDFSGNIETKWGLCAPWTDSDSSAGRFLLGETSFTGSLDAYWGNSSAFAEGSISYDATEAKENNDALSFSLGELWVDYSDSYWGIRIGRQKQGWGKADGVNITNVLCPSDMSSFSALVSDDSSLPIDAIRLTFNSSSFTVDAYWIPFFTPTKFTASPLFSSYEFSELSEPETAIWNAEYALKLSGYFSAMDCSFYAFYGWDDFPIISYKILSATEKEISGSYKRMCMLGFDSAIPLGETVIRLETAFFPQRAFQKAFALGTSDYSEKHNQISALAGLDWMPSGWTITAQYFCDYVFGDLSLLDRTDSYKHGITLSLSKSILNETLELSFSGLMNFNAFDSLLSPSATYSLSDQIKLSTGAYIFIPGPSEDGEYGAYKDYSSFFIKISMSF